MDTRNLRAYCEMCYPQNWKHEPRPGGDRDEILAGRAHVATAPRPDAAAITAFGNAMPELLDTIDRLEGELEGYRAKLGEKLAL